MGLQNDRKEQTALIEKLKKDHDDSKSEADDAHRGAISIFNEQKKHETHIQRLQSEVHRANSAVEKMKTETVSLRIKNQDVRDERANQRAVEERDSTILDLRSLLESRNRELNVLEQSEANTQVERTRLQLYSNEMSMSLVAIRQELEKSRAAATAA